MKTTVIALTFIWIGLVLGISFVEAPLKFQAPNMTLELGLGIGRLVFGALTKIEIGLALIISLCLYRIGFNWQRELLYVIAIIVLALQSFWLMPTMTKRIDLILDGQQVESTYHHLLYILLEACKVITLLAAGIKVIKTIEQNGNQA